MIIKEQVYLTKNLLFCNKTIMFVTKVLFPIQPFELYVEHGEMGIMKKKFLRDYRGIYRTSYFKYYF